MIKATYIGSCEQKDQSLAQARQILEAAVVKATTIVRKARLKAAKRIRILRQRAFLAGYYSGTRAALSEHLTQLVALQANYNKALIDAQKECLELSLTIAREVLGSEVLTQREALAKRIERTIHKLLEQRDLRIVLHPNDSNQVSKILSARLSSHAIQIERSEAIEEGCAIISTISGSITLSWNEHLKLIEERLLHHTSTTLHYA